jgi:hypothetical protein
MQGAYYSGSLDSAAVAIIVRVPAAIEIFHNSFVHCPFSDREIILIADDRAVNIHNFRRVNPSDCFSACVIADNCFSRAYNRFVSCSTFTAFSAIASHDSTSLIMALHYFMIEGLSLY